MKIVREGFKYSRKRFNPPKSPPGFQWPRKATAEDKRHFAASIKRLAEERGMERLDLAKVITGEIINAAGFRTARDAFSITKWWNGEALPREDSATVLGAYFKTSLAEMLGKPHGAAVNGHANGHAHERGGSAIRVKAKGGEVAKAQPVPTPASGTAAFVKIETFAKDPRFVTVTVSGTMPLDTALSIMALLDPSHESDSGQ
jgi:hypothetical protein